MSIQNENIEIDYSSKCLKYLATTSVVQCQKKGLKSLNHYYHVSSELVRILYDRDRKACTADIRRCQTLLLSILLLSPELPLLLVHQP